MLIKKWKRMHCHIKKMVSADNRPHTLTVVAVVVVRVRAIRIEVEVVGVVRVRRVLRRRPVVAVRAGIVEVGVVAIPGSRHSQKAYSSLLILMIGGVPYFFVLGRPSLILFFLTVSYYSKADCLLKLPTPVCWNASFYLFRYPACSI